MRVLDRILLALAGLAGLLGVALSAAAAHRDGGETGRTAAYFLLFHAPLVVALAATGAVNGLAARVSAVAILLGLALFSGDLAVRALAGTPLFAYAAPGGGFALMAGWLATCVAPFLPKAHRVS